MSHGRHPDKDTTNLTMETAGLAQHTPCCHQAEKEKLMAVFPVRKLRLSGHQV